MLGGLRTVGFNVGDLEAAKRWYTEILGYPPYFDQPFYVGFDVAGYELGLHPAEPGDPVGAGGSTAYWAVPDVAAAQAALVARGATVRQPPIDVGGDIVVGSVTDPFGNVLGLITNPHFAAEGATPPWLEAEGSHPVAGVRLGAEYGDLSPRQIRHERHVAAPVADVWHLWSTSEGVSAWLTHSAHIECRIGGPYEIYFLDDAPEGSRGSEGCRVLSFIPERMLSFTWNAPPEHVETRPQHTWVVVELEPATAGTLVRVTHLGWPESGLADEAGPWRRTFDYFDRAWGRVLDELEQHTTR